MKIQEKERVSLEAQLEAETLEVFASIDHFLTPQEYTEVLFQLTQDPFFNQSAAIYEEAYSKTNTNFSIPALANIYRSANQERYSILMKAYTEMGAFLKSKLDWNFYQTLTFFSCVRHCMQRTLTLPLSYNIPKTELHIIPQGYPRTKLATTTLNGVYENLRDFYSEKQKATEPRVFEFNYIGRDYNNEEIVLSSVMGNTQFWIVYHTDENSIDKSLNHVDFLYKQIQSSNDKKEIISLSGKFFWWICQIKPWNLGDPSIAEMLFRSIWSEKGIPNDSWISSVIPWCETLKESDVEIFGENFDKLFERSTVDKVEIAADNFF